MKNLFQKITSFFLALSLFACSTLGTPITIETPQTQPTVTQAKPVATEIPGMLTVPPPTATVLPTADSTAALSAVHLTIKCLEISPAIPDNIDWSGKVFLAGRFVVGKGYSGPDSMMDLRTGIVKPIPPPENVYQGSYLISPNRDRLAYIMSNLDANGKPVDFNLVIADLEGKVLTKVPGSRDDWDSFYWLDNEQVVIGSYGQPAVLNPFTGNIYDMAKWYAQSPGGLKTIPVWGVNGVFNSQLSQLFYIQEDDTLLLWDLESKKVLAKLDHNSIYNPGGQPRWSWDDEEILVAYPLAGADKRRELFSVSRDGEISQLTELNKYYSEAIISKFSWSPDGHNIAFFFIDLSQEDSQYQFAILNRETLQVTNYCNLGGFMDPNVDPVWSPDGTQVLIGRMEADLIIFKTILVDLSSEYAAQLVENLVPVGWMTTSQP